MSEQTPTAEPETPNRYFIIFFEAITIIQPSAASVLSAPMHRAQEANKPKTVQGRGEFNVVTPGHFPIKAQVVGALKAKHSFTNVAIVNILEVSEADMACWEMDPSEVAAEPSA